MFDAIRILYRQDDSLALYGLPYLMRTGIGQQPQDINELRRGDWICLGAPGRETPETLAWLASLADVPEGPHEWCVVEQTAS